MVKFIFDLDYTLYSANDCIETDNSNIFYNSFKKKNFMNSIHIYSSSFSCVFKKKGKLHESSLVFFFLKKKKNKKII